MTTVGANKLFSPFFQRGGSSASVNRLLDPLVSLCPALSGGSAGPGAGLGPAGTSGAAGTSMALYTPAGLGQSLA